LNDYKRFSDNGFDFALNLQGAARMPLQTEFKKWGICPKPLIDFFLAKKVNKNACQNDAPARSYKKQEYLCKISLKMRKKSMIIIAAT